MISCTFPNFPVSRPHVHEPVQTRTMYCTAEQPKRLAWCDEQLNNPAARGQTETVPHETTQARTESIDSQEANRPRGNTEEKPLVRQVQHVVNQADTRRFQRRLVCALQMLARSGTDCCFLKSRRLTEVHYRGELAQ